LPAGLRSAITFVTFPTLINGQIFRFSGYCLPSLEYLSSVATRSRDRSRTIEGPNPEHRQPNTENRSPKSWISDP